jgi:iron-sulfur cluster assembly protein
MMSEVTSPQTPPPPAPAPKPVVRFGITDAAVARLSKLLAERGTPEAGLRIAVKGGGCSGLTYSMEWAETGRERDKIAEREGVRVFIDPKSYLYLMGTELDYAETLMASGFKLNNPNVKTACGCGESFTI